VDKLIFHASTQGLEGTAAPMKEGDNLDVVSAPGIAQDIQTPQFAKPASSIQSGGLGLSGKMFFVLLIVTACVVFVRTRKDSTNTPWKD